MKSKALSFCVLLSLAGLALTSYLYAIHLGLLRGEFLGEAVCGGAAMNCHAVTGSRFGQFWGMPLSLWGAAGYGVCLGLSLLALQGDPWKRHAASLLAALALVFVTLDAFLLIVMAAVIRQFCALCLATYAVNFLLLLAVMRGNGRSFKELLAGAGPAFGALFSFRALPSAGFFWAIALISFGAAGALHAATTYVRSGTLKSMLPQVQEYVASQPRAQVSAENRPSKGVGDRFVLVEFSDFLCPVCQKAARINSILVANHRQELRFVYKHFPLDATCNTALHRSPHPGACKISEASACAYKQNKFWEFHDVVYAAEGGKYPVNNIREDARKIGLDMEAFEACIESGEGMAIVREDIEEAQRLKVGSTPTYYLNGVPIRGLLFPETFEHFREALGH